jgi:SAM-dependent methyltransferase
MTAAERAQIQEYFEQGFLQRPLSEQVEDVRSYYLYDRICAMAAAHQPLLEAGCGPGQWVAMAASRGWEAIGVDWSPSLMERAAAEVQNARFLVGDIRRLPIADASVGSVMSLGAIEHAIEGPEAALREFRRVLRPGGVALITVPFLGPVRRMVWHATRRAWYSPRLRRVLGRKRGLHPLRRDLRLRDGWTADFLATEDGWSFFQYQFDKPTMRHLLTGVGFAVNEEFVFAPEEGLVQTFNRAAGKYTDGGIDLSAVGRLLQALLPAETYEHMLGYMVRKPG